MNEKTEPRGLLDELSAGITDAVHEISDVRNVMVRSAMTTGPGSLDDHLQTAILRLRSVQPIADFELKDMLRAAEEHVQVVLNLVRAYEHGESAAKQLMAYSDRAILAEGRERHMRQVLRRVVLAWYAMETPSRDVHADLAAEAKRVLEEGER